MKILIIIFLLNITNFAFARDNRLFFISDDSEEDNALLLIERIEALEADLQTLKTEFADYKKNTNQTLLESLKNIRQTLNIKLGKLEKDLKLEMDQSVLTFKSEMELALKSFAKMQAQEVQTIETLKAQVKALQEQGSIIDSGMTVFKEAEWAKVEKRVAICHVENFNKAFEEKPKVFLAVNHSFVKNTTVVHDPVIAWLEYIDTEKFTVCVMELAGYDNMHSDVNVDWLVIQ